MPSYSCSSSRHLPTRLLQLCPLRSAFITLQLLSSVLHAAVRVIKDLSPTDHITPTLKQRHWLPILPRIAFKIFLLMYHIHSGTSPAYISPMATPCSTSGSRETVQEREEILL